jgi:uncharacterized protein
MLIEFFGENFRCFRDEFRLSMLATDIDPGSERGIVEVRVEGDETPLRLLRAAALYGANASGKSTVIRAARALGWLLSNSGKLGSDAELGPYEPFASEPHSTQPVRLGARAVIEGVVYEYSISYRHSEVVAEQLLRLGETETTLFRRNAQIVDGAWTEDEQFNLMRRVFRKNALVLSLADSLVPKVARKIAVGLRTLLNFWQPAESVWDYFDTSHVAGRVHADAPFRSWLLAQLSSADVGVVDIHTEEFQIPAAADPGAQRRLGFAKGENGVRLSLYHSGAERPFLIPYYDESLGTRRLVEMSPLVYDLSHSKRPFAAFADEFDASMHPLVLQNLIRHINCEIPMDQVRGQLIFAAHETTLLDDEAKDAVLRRDQVYFTEKGTDGASRLYSVAEFKERNNLNMRRRYLQGRYGALPALGALSE